ncbi:hypothetical protein Gohar_012812 [Gossypium harknessii]|uniref:Uncharacterized protein n=1 Tax=Gossypium harknessii TaxID=34285 RepID=A0A7J9GYY3_9ROSI|nr:hypothetical protein [Gossypium harknessii]
MAIGDAVGSSSQYHNIKEVCFKNTHNDAISDMVVDLASTWINFSNRIQQILMKDMVKTLVIKLLGRSIGYVALHDRITILLAKQGEGNLPFGDGKSESRGRKGADGGLLGHHGRHDGNS